MKTHRFDPLVAAGLLTAAALIGAGGCISATEVADSARRRDLVMVPQDAQPVDSLRWSRIRTMRPLNRRMILIDADRPYLLVLSDSCLGLRPDSVIVTDARGRTFQPRVDNILVVDPLMSVSLPGGINNQLSTLAAPLQASQFSQGTTICRPDTLYAIREEDVAGVRAAVSREDEDAR